MKKQRKKKFIRKDDYGEKLIFRSFGRGIPVYLGIYCSEYFLE